MKLTAFILALLMFLSASPLYAIDLSYPDALQGEQVAQVNTEGVFGTVTKHELMEYLRVEREEVEAVLAAERDKTNDTVALAAWGLLLVMALTNQGRHGNDGADGSDGAPGVPGPPGPPGPPGGCH